MTRDYARGRQVAVGQRRREALPAPSMRARHLDAADGRRPQARLVVGADHARWRSGCTRTATSPTCVPTRRTCRRRRSTPPASRPVSSTATPTSRPRRVATRSKAKGAQEAHEAIHDFGDNFRTPGAARPPAGPRRVPALRARLAADGRLADGRRGRADGQHRLAGRSATDEAVRFHRLRPHHHLPRLPQGLRRVPRRRLGVGWRRRQRQRRRRAPAAAPRARPAARHPGARRQGHTTSPRRGTPSPAWSPGSRSSASAARRPTRRSCRRSRTAGTCGRRATPSCPPSSRSPW